MGKWAKHALLLAVAASVFGIYGPLAEGVCLARDTGGIVQPARETEKQDRSAKEITRRGRVVIISQALANDIKRDGLIVLSKVVIKTRVGKDGRIEGYELAEVDRGSIPDKLGFKPKDLVSEVNGTPARDFIANQTVLESAGRFNVTILRKGRAKKLVVEIR
jgi:type II secretory pathway component PulC